jgi:hypothetical protein
MQIRDLPDISRLEALQKFPKIRLEPGQQFTAQVESNVVPVEAGQIIAETLTALCNYVPESLDAFLEVLQLALLPLTDEEKKEIREAILKIEQCQQAIAEKGSVGNEPS